MTNTTTNTNANTVAAKDAAGRSKAYDNAIRNAFYDDMAASVGLADFSYYGRGMEGLLFTNGDLFVELKAIVKAEGYTYAQADESIGRKEAAEGREEARLAAAKERELAKAERDRVKAAAKEEVHSSPKQ